MSVKTIRVFGREITKKDGKKFVSYSYTNDGSMFYRIKFTQDCENRPAFTGYVLLTVDTENVSLQKPSKNDNYPQNVLWIKKVESFVKDEKYIAEKDALRAKDIADIMTDNSLKD